MIKELKNGKKGVDLTLTLTVTEEDVENIICTAFYGGISYWCRKVTKEEKKSVGSDVKAAQHLWEGGTLIFWEDEEETGENLTPHEVTLDKLLKGVQRYITEGYTYSYDILSHENGNLTLDCGMIDAEVADCMVQFACFDDVVYG